MPTTKTKTIKIAGETFSLRPPNMLQQTLLAEVLSEVGPKLEELNPEVDTWRAANTISMTLTAEHAEDPEWSEFIEAKGLTAKQLSEGVEVQQVPSESMVMSHFAPRLFAQMRRPLIRVIAISIAPRDELVDEEVRFNSTDETIGRMTGLILSAERQEEIMEAFKEVFQEVVLPFVEEGLPNLISGVMGAFSGTDEESELPSTPAKSSPKSSTGSRSTTGGAARKSSARSGGKSSSSST